MAISVTILGSNSAIPTANRFPTAQVINVNQSYYLVDCGEGTQMQMRKYGIKIQRIKAIFITHLHGDHYFGLIGLLNTMHLLGRQSSLELHGPSELLEILELMFKHADTRLQFDLNFRSIEENSAGKIYEDGQVAVSNFPLKHRIKCSGFRFDELPKMRKIKKSALDAYQVPIEKIKNIKEGADFELSDGTIVRNEVLTSDPLPAKSFAFCSDTKYTESILPYINKVDLLYHEATFTEEFKERATKNLNSTAKQAATLAEKAEVGQLIIGPHSAR